MQIDLLLLLGVTTSILSLILFFLYLKQKNSISFMQEKIRELLLEKSTLSNELSAIEREYAVLEARNEEQISSSFEKLRVLKEAKEELSKEFQLLSTQIFEEKSKQFSLANREQMEFLLQPFRQQIDSFTKESREQFEVQIKEGYLLKNELMNLKEMNAQLSEDALNLTKALKGENKTQGNWGELVLERILEQSGLRKGVEYELQASLYSQEQKLYRPDVIIHLPQERDIVIDSKVSLVAYERFINAEESALKMRALKEHITSISNHIKELSQKSYEKLHGINSLDFVLLFMPIEGAFSLALQEDDEFFKRAYRSNILVVSPSTLLVTLRTIEHIWRTQHQEENAKKIAAEAEAIYDKLVGFVEEMQAIGKNIQKTQNSYDSAMNRLHRGRGNLIKRAENMRALGLNPKKELLISGEEG